jgi:hypothetical protein
MGRISLKRRRAAQRQRRALAGLAGISLSLVIACWSASAAGRIFTSSCMSPAC